jgi:hypothetical protein
MEDNNNLRHFLIFVFTILLIISSYFLGKTKSSEVINKSQIEIENLNKLNEDLLVQNDSLDIENHKYDSVIFDLNRKISTTMVEITKVNTKIIKLNEIKTKKYKYIDNSSANDVADSLSRFIEDRRKSQSSDY